ncbi:MAG: hypothetical protein PVJ95_12600 [Cellvibrionales bacterium]
MAKANAEFSDIGNAFASINDASAEKPYLLLVEPGIYQTENIVVKNSVHIMGSGKKATKLECDGCGFVLSWFGNGDLNITISNLSIVNTGGANGVNFVDFGDICTVTLDSVEVRVSNGAGGPSAAISGSSCNMEISKADTFGSAADGNAAYDVYVADTVSLTLKDSLLGAAAGEPSAAILTTNDDYVELKDLDIGIKGGSSASMLHNVYGVSVMGKKSGVAGHYFDDIRIDVTARYPVAVRALNGANVKIADSRLHANTLDEKNGASFALQVEGTETNGSSTFSGEARVATSELKGIRRCISGCARICVIQSYTDAFTALPDGCAGPN